MEHHTFLLIVMAVNFQHLKSGAPAPWLHLRVLYTCVVLTLLGTLGGFWITFNELRNLRRDLNAEIAKRAHVEFSLQDFDARNNVLFTHEAAPSGGGRRSPAAGAVPRETELRGAGEPGEEEPGDGDDQLIRVKRSNAIYEEGSGLPEDHVWMTGYAKIPVSCDFILPVVASLRQEIFVTPPAGGYHCGRRRHRSPDNSFSSEVSPSSVLVALFRDNFLSVACYRSRPQANGSEKEPSNCSHFGECFVHQGNTFAECSCSCDAD